MSLTVREALQLDPLSQGALVSGQGGLDNEIRWVTIVEVLEDADRLQEGELLVTTAYGLEQDVARHRSYVAQLARRNLAGLVVVTGFYLTSVPADVIAEAEAHNLPVIQLPPTINFSDITRSVLERIVNQQYSLLHASENVHRELTELALGSRGLPEVAAVLGRWTKGQILISDREGNLVASSGEWAGGQTLLAAALAEQATGKQPCESTDRRDGAAGEPNRVVVPIRASTQHFGYIVLVKPVGTIRKFDLVAVGHAATVGALLFMREQAVTEAEQRLRGDFLDEVLGEGGLVEPQMAIEKARTLGCNFTRPHQVVLFTLRPPDPGLLARLGRCVQQTLQGARRRFLLRQNSWAVVVLMETNGTDQGSQLALQAVQRWEAVDSEHPPRVGIGNVYGEVAAFAQSAREAAEAARLGHLLLPPRPVVLYRELGIYHVAAEMERSHIDLKAVYTACLGKLSEEGDKARDLAQTLETYLSHNANTQSTAKALFVHRHTLRYRLHRIEQITGRDLNNPLDRLQLHLGLTLHNFVQARSTRLG